MAARNSCKYVPLFLNFVPVSPSDQGCNRFMSRAHLPRSRGRCPSVTLFDASVAVRTHGCAPKPFVCSGPAMRARACQALTHAMHTTGPCTVLACIAHMGLRSMCTLSERVFHRVPGRSVARRSLMPSQTKSFRSGRIWASCRQRVPSPTCAIRSNPLLGRTSARQSSACLLGLCSVTDRTDAQRITVWSHLVTKSV